MLKPYPLASMLLVIIAGPLAAQQPTSGQREAIRSACRTDFVANCSEVKPGTKEALECLLRFEAKLSAACKAAVSAVAAKPGEPAAAPGGATDLSQGAAQNPPSEPPKAPPAEAKEDQMSAVRQACTLDDFVAHCSWIQPSSPEVLLCLRANLASLSAPCQAALQAAPAAPNPSPSPGASPAAAETQPAERAPAAPAVPARKPPPTAPAAIAAPPAPAAKEAGKPSAEERSAIRAACRSDFMSRCQGVKPGGAEALQCLERNTAQLSARCRSAVAAIGNGAPAAGANEAAAPAAAPATAAAPIGPMPEMRPRQALAILRICSGDERRLCGGMPPGGGRIIACLAENAASLSPGCRAALSAARR
jgi:hypothetical protein